MPGFLFDLAEQSLWSAMLVVKFSSVSLASGFGMLSCIAFLFRSFLMRLILLTLLPLLATSSAIADITRSNETWKVKPNFEKSDKARESISGAACVPGLGQCLAVNDEKKYAQFFQIRDLRLEPGPLVRLLPGKINGEKTKEIDAEGAVYVPPEGSGDPGSYFVTGSHGLSRSGEFQQSRFVLFRIPVDPATGLPTFNFNDKKVAPEISRTTLLQETIRNTEPLSAFAEKTLDRNGVTIEGLSVMGEDLLFGLRSPCLSEHALVMRVPINELFKNTAPSAKINQVKLGDNVGIRDLTAVDGGFLILSGRSDDRRGDQKLTCGEKRSPPSPFPAVWFWSGKDEDAAEPLGRLPGIDANDSAETLLVLEETQEAYRILILLDGKKNGAPVEFLVEK
ncbi:MAG: DUF3616 domain-containing protein [Pseudomonadota bacterium]